jgi:hypothetical protein
MKRIVICLLFTALIVSAQTKKPAKTETKESKCIAGANELCASDKFYSEYARLKEIQAKYAPPPDVQLIMRGITADLQDEINLESGQGYKWDEKKYLFTKPAPASAQPAPEPKK